mmetsp:Transcript_27117/g.54564  ORF Transcript_27117/g.54564 Transcript_27117/m.54564 type:complete len:89 (-) Transcript_27117:57-323(-)
MGDGPTLCPLAACGDGVRCGGTVEQSLEALMAITSSTGKGAGGETGGGGGDGGDGSGDGDDGGETQAAEGWMRGLSRVTDGPVNRLID